MAEDPQQTTQYKFSAAPEGAKAPSSYPTVPGADANELLEKLLSNLHIDQELQKRWWALFGVTSKLTFLTEADVKNAMLDFELLRLRTISKMPKHECTPELLIELQQVGLEFEFNLRRSKGLRLNLQELISAIVHATFSERGIPQPHVQNAGWAQRIAEATRTLAGGKKNEP